MAKKQILFKSSDLEQLIKLEKQVNFVMLNQAVFLATPKLIKSDIVKVKNTKGHTLDLPITQIQEIWGEEKATNS
ncbi:hypothetical protein [Marinoscillum pacificum]|uniref:hypothetical protein n=1 Tax=Marinoscillum pacificum TaxID=392723 RepID=UPI002157AB5A|nr:hypothetical protein [Marinoscillum pacificum]